MSGYAPRIDVEILDAAGEVRTILGGWQDLELTHDLEAVVPTGIARAVLDLSDPAQSALIAAQDRVAVSVDGVRQFTGLVGGAGKQLAPPTLAVELVGCTADALASDLPEAYSVTGKTVAQIAEELLRPWGIAVVADIRGQVAAQSYRPRSREEIVRPSGVYNVHATDVERLRRAVSLSRTLEEFSRRSEELTEYAYSYALDTTEGARAAWESLLPRRTVVDLVETRESRELRPQPDETIGSFLRRLLKGHGLRMAEDAWGRLALYTPDYTIPSDRCYVYTGDPTRAVNPRWSEGVILSGSHHERHDVVTDVVVVGRGAWKENPAIRYETRRATARPGRLVRRKILDTAIRDSDEARKRAETTIAEAEFGAEELEVEIEGYGTGPRQIVPGSMVAVRAPVFGVRGDYYVLSRTVTFGSGGPITRLRLIRPGTWVDS